MKNKSHETKRKRGRPKEQVPQEVVQELIEWVQAGGTIRGWAAQPGKVSFSTVYNWAEKDDEFSTRLAKARESSCHALAEECLIISNTRPDEPLTLGWHKLRIDTNLRLMAKWNPAKYGDRQQLDHAGGIILNVVTNVPRD
jgi:hypothetical protein